MKDEDFDAKNFIQKSKELDKNFRIDSGKYNLYDLKYNEKKFLRLYNTEHCKICGKMFKQKQDSIWCLVFGTPCYLCFKCYNKLKAINDKMFGE